MKILFDATSSSNYHTMPLSLFEELQKGLSKHNLVYVRNNQVENEIEDTDILVCYNFSKDNFSKAKKLKLVIYATDGMGTKRLFPELINSDIIVTNSRGCRSQAIAEHSVMLILACSRNLPFMMENITTEGWWGSNVANNIYLPGEISGKTIMVLGLGNIGSRIAKIVKKGFGMKVIGVVKHPRELDNADIVIPLEQITKYLPETDIVAITLPETLETEKLFGKKEFEAMKENTILINVSRGGVIETNEIVNALNSGRLAYAGLDVFDEEPLPANHPIRTCKNVIMTPHASGITPYFWARFGAIIKKNIINFESGQPLINLVDKSSGY
jgi:phosphoglycerate dehydrogenase-like enzyme